MKINKLHFYFGLATFTGFVITGILMRINFFDVDHRDIQTRIMFRSNHIYILLASVIHLVISFLDSDRCIRWIMKTGSLLTILSTITLYIAFYIDPITRSIQRDITRFSIVGLFAGSIIVLMSYKFFPRKNSNV